MKQISSSFVIQLFSTSFGGAQSGNILNTRNEF
jgi:hypothetical protein